MPLKLKADEIIADSAITLNGDQRTSWPIAFTFIRGEVPSGTVDGVNAIFTLASAPAAGALVLFLNGIRLGEGASNDYTLSGLTITMTSAPQVGDTLIADYHF